MDPRSPNTFNELSLCAGGAMLTLGLRMVIRNLCTRGYVEREAFPLANLVSKIEIGELDDAPVGSDVKTFDGRPYRGKIHIITSGDPCQSLSVAGQRLGPDDDRYLWPHIKRIVAEVRPLFVFLENVPPAFRERYPIVRADLESLGYETRAGFFSAEETGASHERKRFFTLSGMADTLRLICYPRGKRAGRQKGADAGGGVSIAELAKRHQAEWIPQTACRCGGGGELSLSGERHKNTTRSGATGGGSLGAAPELDDGYEERDREQEQTIPTGGDAIEPAGAHGSGECAKLSDNCESGRGEGGEMLCAGESVPPYVRSSSGLNHSHPDFTRFAFPRFEGGPAPVQWDWEPPRLVSQLADGDDLREPQPGGVIGEERRRALDRLQAGELSDGETPHGRSGEAIEQSGTGERWRGPRGGLYTSGDEGTTEPALGGDRHHGAAVGVGRSTSRIDEIALLGEGCVPATAELAFRTLYPKLLRRILR